MRAPEQIEIAREALLQLARNTIQNNQDCFIANWVMQNPTELLSDYKLCHKTDWCAEGSPTEFWIEKKL
jgi:hypothetical protein